MVARKRSKSSLPAFVQKHGAGFRGWFMEGRKQRRGPVVSTPEEAHKWALERRAEQALPEGDLTLGTALELVRRELRITRRREGTARWYEDQFAVIRRAWDEGMPLRTLDARQVEWFVQRRLQQGVTAATVRHGLRALSRVFSVAQRQGLVHSNPVTGARKPSVEERPPDRFSHEEILALLERIRPRSRADADTIQFLYTTGLRRTEAAHVQKADVDLPGRELRVMHGKRRPRSLPVPDGLAALLERLAARTDDYLVEGATEAHRAAAITRAFRRWRVKLDEPRLHPHAMRHSFITHLARGGAPEHVIAALAGHKLSASSITQRYVGVHGPQARAAMELLWQPAVSGSKSQARTR